MISSEWAAPKSFKKGFSLPDTQDEGSVPGRKHILPDLHQLDIIIIIIITT
jgi:hypothetical protein